MDNYIKRFYDQEIWKQVTIKSPFAERFEIYVSNYGKLKRITKINQEEKILRQGLTEGYPTANFSIFMPMTEKENLKFIDLRQEIADLKKEISTIELTIENNNENAIERNEHLSKTKNILAKKEVDYKKKYRKCELKRRRTIYFLVHRVLAQHFINQPTEDHNLVAHLDFDKLNNHHSNLKWMTREENVAHQKKSPFVIQSKIKAFEKTTPNTSKLTVSQVMILKKRMNEEGVMLSKLAKRYNVSHTQLLRIKRGINWAKVPAAL